jgi:hypothetical protein
LDSALHIRRYLAADAELRGALGVDEASALLRPSLECTVDLRAARAAGWRRDPRGPHRLTNLGPAGASEADPDVFASFVLADPGVVVLFGRRYDLAALLAAVAVLAGAVGRELRWMKEVMLARISAYEQNR